MSHNFIYLFIYLLSFSFLLALSDNPFHLFFLNMLATRSYVKSYLFVLLFHLLIFIDFNYL